MAKRDWEIVLPRHRLVALRADPGLADILALCRATNAITLAYGPLIKPPHWQSPRALRERFAALYYVGALLHEALKVAQRLGAHFRALPQWKAGFGRLFANPEFTRFRSRRLKPLRNQAIFHFDRRFFAKGLRDLPNEDQIVAITRSTAVKDIFFTLCDDIVFNQVMGPINSHAQGIAAFEELNEQIVAVMGAYVNSAHRLVPAVFRTFGCRRRRRGSAA